MPVANVGAKDDNHKTAFHEYVNFRDAQDKTPLLHVSKGSYRDDLNSRSIVSPMLPD
jgi:hypothetical protein